MPDRNPTPLMTTLFTGWITPLVKGQCLTYSTHRTGQVKGPDKLFNKRAESGISRGPQYT